MKNKQNHKDFRTIEIDTTPGGDDDEVLTDFDLVARTIRQREGKGVEIADVGSSGINMNLDLSYEQVQSILESLRPVLHRMGYSDRDKPQD